MTIFAWGVSITTFSPDWQLQVGEQVAAGTTVNRGEDLESLLDTLAEDVLEAWLDSEEG